MSRNTNKILALYDEMTTFHGLLDLFKSNGCSHDRKTLLNLYNGGKWARNFRSVQGKMNNTSFNIAQQHFVFRLFSAYLLSIYCFTSDNSFQFITIWLFQFLHVFQYLQILLQWLSMGFCILQNILFHVNFK